MFRETSRFYLGRKAPEISSSTNSLFGGISVWNETKTQKSIDPISIVSGINRIDIILNLNGVQSFNASILETNGRRFLTGDTGLPQHTLFIIREGRIIDIPVGGVNTKTELQATDIVILTSPKTGRFLSKKGNRNQLERTLKEGNDWNTVAHDLVLHSSGMLGQGIEAVGIYDVSQIGKDIKKPTNMFHLEISGDVRRFVPETDFFQYASPDRRQKQIITLTSDMLFTIESLISEYELSNMNEKRFGNQKFGKEIYARLVTLRNILEVIESEEDTVGNVNGKSNIDAAIDNLVHFNESLYRRTGQYVLGYEVLRPSTDSSTFDPAQTVPYSANRILAIQLTWGTDPADNEALNFIVSNHIPLRDAPLTAA